jgi:hypothetical protein
MPFPEPWTRERCLAAAHEFSKHRGRPPTSIDWDPYRLRRAGMTDRLKVWDAGTWPGRSTVFRLFGSWTAFMEAAGFPPNRARPRGHGRALVVVVRDEDADTLGEAEPQPISPFYMAVKLRSVRSAYAARDTEALRAHLFELSAVALHWARELDSELRGTPNASPAESSIQARARRERA